MPYTVLIDGPSGSGKTTWAKQLAATTGFDLVHLDDFYPGWGGLAAGAAMVARDVLRLEQPGFRRWDWQHDRPGDWQALDPTRDLIVEGVGAITNASISAAQRRGPVRTILVSAPAAVRRDRALNRDPEFGSWWDAWARQEVEHFAFAPPSEEIIAT